MVVLNNVVSPFLVNAFVAEKYSLNVYSHVLLVLSIMYVKLRVIEFGLCCRNELQ